MWSSVRAELTKLGRRPATWLLLAIALALSQVFAYLVPYAGASGGTGDPAAGPGSDALVTDLLPSELVGNSIGGLPIFLGALALILGALVVGGEYGWGTWKTVLVQGPSRLTAYAAKVIVLAAATLVGVAVLFLSGAATSAAIAAAESAPLRWPGLPDLAAGVGAGWLMALMWATLGALLGVALRGVALPIGLGLVWLLAVQNLLASIAAPLLSWVETLQKGLPGPNAGSLAASLGSPADTPGVAELVTPGHAIVVLLAYLAGFVIAGAVLLRRRDVL